ncbi:hypothetical protein LSTR_LSTR005669 [Laodelphax striatellus]|uniref:ETS domain-containing protein n=1 Tax=Laodelphax striatellus TaxID=195883 RepID=A0A482X9C1_LAOST|nr:hypothetical protein LSTR_LSTR005669 [Laodelphax striatellus]
MQNIYGDNCTSTFLGRLVADSTCLASYDIGYLEDDFAKNAVINADVNLNKAHWGSYDNYYDNQPMELGRDDAENKTETLSEWMSKPVIKWSVKDTLAWLTWVAKENNCDCMGFETNMYAFSEIKGSELNQLTREDFLSMIPKREFALQLYGHLLKLKENSDLYGIQSPYLDVDNYTNSSHQIVPLISVSSSYDSGDNASLYPLQDDFERNDSGYEDPSDSELQLSIPMMGIRLGGQSKPESDTNNELLRLPAGGGVSPWGGAGAIGEGEQTSSEEEEEEVAAAEEAAALANETKKKPGRPRGIRKKKPEKLGRLWEFIRDLLNDSRYCPSIICWDDYEKGTFRFVQSEKVARLWGDKKENPEMNFEKFSRAMRYYYKSKVLIAVQRRLVYQFGPKAMIRQNQALQSSNHFNNGFPS